MMDIHESAQEFRHLAAKSTVPAITDDEDDEMVLNYSDSEDDHSSKVSKSENLTENLDLLDKDNQMEIADDNFSTKMNNGIGTAAIDQTDSNDKQDDEGALLKPEKISLSLLDRFLCSEVVENGQENITELIGDELVDEVANEVIDENALLDEITNDLDQDELDDECLTEEDITDIGTKDEAAMSTNVSKICDSGEVNGEETIENVADAASKTVIGSSGETTEVDDHQPIEKDCKPDSTEVSTETEGTGINDPKAEEITNEAVIEKSVSTTKADDDKDNYLLEEMSDSPRSSEHESMTSEMLEKDDTVIGETRNEKPHHTAASSNENSNMSDSGATTTTQSDVVGEFKHDAEIHIMDDAGISLEANTVAVDDMIKQTKEEVDLELCPDEKVVEHTSPSDNLAKTGDEVVSYATPSPEPPCKRKSDEEIYEPENKKKRLEEDVTSTAESVGSPENATTAGNDMDTADINDSNTVAIPVVDQDTQKDSSDTNKDDDDDVLIVGEINQTKKSSDAQPSDEITAVQEPVQKAKILILDTEAIAADLCDDMGDNASAAEGSTVPENDSQVSISPDASIVEKEAEPPVTTTDKTSQRRAAKSPATLTLDPAPQKSLCPTAFSLNFVRKFQKNFDKMTRNDLEELLIQKCVEVIVHKSDYAEMRNKIEKQESKLQSYSIKYQELNKQYRDLDMVHQRVIKDLEVKNQSVVTPVKITRAVGLQVSLPRKEIICAIQKPVPPTTAVAPGNAMQNVAQQNAALARNRRKVPPQRPNEPNISPQQQHQQQILRQNMMLSRRPELQMQRNQFGQSTQHLQQQQGQNNLLKQQLIQNNSPNNLRQQQPATNRKPVSQFSPVAANQMQNSSPKTPASAERQRVAPVILKKTTPTRMVTVNSPGSNAAAMYSSQSKVANTSITRTAATSTSMNNLIDLTDEEDSRRVAQNGTNPPALVAIPNNHGNKTVVGQGKVNFNVAVKSATNQAQLQMAQQNRLAAMQKGGCAYVPIAPKSNGTTGQIVQLRQKQQPPTSLTAVQRRQHPAPLPYPNVQSTNPFWKLIPPRPIIRISNIPAGIVISWTMDEMTEKHAEVASYQIYAYQETSAAPSPETWRHVGDVKAMLLPMAVTLTQFQEGQRYHFAVRAVDEHSRYGIFSLPKTW